MSGLKLPTWLHWVLGRRSWKDLHTVGSPEKLQASPGVLQGTTELGLLFHTYPPTKILDGQPGCTMAILPLVARGQSSLISLYPRYRCFPFSKVLYSPINPTSDNLAPSHFPTFFQPPSLFITLFQFIPTNPGIFLFLSFSAAHQWAYENPCYY